MKKWVMPKVSALNILETKNGTVHASGEKKNGNSGTYKNPTYCPSYPKCQ